MTLGASSAVAQANRDRPIYLEELRKRSPDTARILRTISSKEGGEGSKVTPAQLQLALDTLYRQPLGDSLLRARLDSKSAPREARYLGARAWVEGQVRRRQAELGPSLREHQREGAKRALASQAPPRVDELRARWPLAPQAALAARRAWDLAVARGDRAGAQELRAWTQRWHPEAPAWPSFPPLDPASLPPAATAPPGGRLVLRESLAFEPGAARGGASARCLPSLVGGHVVISDGARLHVYSPQGASKGSFPLTIKASSKGPDETTPFEGRVASWGNIAFAPLLLDGPLAPARRSRLADGSFAGRYFSLVGYDVQQGRLRWWDGDAGRRHDSGTIHGGAPPGWEESPLLESLRGAHALGCATGPLRVYLAYTLQGQDPDLYVMAFERVTHEGGQLGLRPAWSAPTKVLTAERRTGDAGDPLLAPEFSVALTLHPSAGVVVSTDIGVVASISPREGQVRWLRQVAPGDSRLRLPAEPALTCGPAALAYLYRGRLVSLEATTGLLRWSKPLGNPINAPRHLLSWDGELLVSGGPELWWVRKLDGVVTGGRTLGVNNRAVGRCARVGTDRLLIPNWVQGPRSAVVVFGRKSDRIEQRLELPGFAGPASVQAWGEAVVLASTHRVAFLRWRAPQERGF